jgi:hypothetical protein
MLSSLLSEVVDFLKAALDKVFVGLLYGLGLGLGLHVAQFLLSHLVGNNVMLPL